MFPLKIALIAIGGTLVFFGVQEYRVSAGASEQPVEIELADLENGQAIPSNYVKIGRHVGVFWAAIRAYKQPRFEEEKAEDSTKCDCCYCPIVSLTHPYFVKREALKARLESPNSMRLTDEPQETTAPKVGNVRVLVKTRRFDTLGDVPEDYSEVASVQGLVTNRISSLSEEEQEYLLESIPDLDFDNLYLLEEGRKPSSTTICGGMIGGGALLVVLGCLWMFRSGH